MKSILTLLITILLSSTAMAGSGTINIQATPAGAKYFIVSNKELKIVRAGASPYYDRSFPTGKYKICFELDGYATVWEDAIVNTVGSAWVFPVLKRDDTATFPVSCESAASNWIAEEKKYPVEIPEFAGGYPSGGYVEWATESSCNPPRDEHGDIIRSESARNEFMRATGFPDGRPGYVVDHVIPLKRCGADDPSNMQWQTIEDAKAKNRWE